MTARADVVVVRLRAGGVLVAAAAASLPWPRVVDRKYRRMQEGGLDRALADHAAMTRLRAELPHLLGQHNRRNAQPDSDWAAVAALKAAARQGRLTLLFGYGEPSLREGRSDELPGLYEEHPVIEAEARGVRNPNLDPTKALPPPTEPLPAQFEPRLRWAAGRAPQYMAPEVALKMREFFGEAKIAVTVALLKLWALSEQTGAGFTVDAAMFATAASEKGHDATLAFDALSEAFVLVRDASGWRELDKAAARLAFAVERLGHSLFRQFLRRIGDRYGRR